MKSKISLFAALFFSIIFTSCFNGLKNSKGSNVSFILDEASVQKIVASVSDATNQKTGNYPLSSARDAGDSDAQELFIEVTLCGQQEETQTQVLSKEVKMVFEQVPVNSRVYAKAQVYKYTDENKRQKEIIYRGQSKTITVRESGNFLTIGLTYASLTVTFNTNGASEILPVTVKSGSPVEEPEKPVKPAGKKKYDRENFAFAGWYTDPELTQSYNFELPVTNDMTLYAKWLPDYVFVAGKTINDYLTEGRNLKIHDLFVSDHEVTQAEYYALTKESPSQNKADSAETSDLPVENVSWFDALAYCNLLSIKEGLTPSYKINDKTDPKEWGSLTEATNVSLSMTSNGYRLPTEAEWEYIAGKALRTNTDFINIAYTAANSGNKTHPVKYSLADELCLCDLFGNVAEWCYDIYSATLTNSTGPTGPMATGAVSRVVRGGSYQSDQEDCTSQARSYASPTNRDSAIGFRLVRTVVYEYKVIKNTVTFNSNGGSAVSAQLVVDGDTAQEPAEPTKTGYNFQGWQLAGGDFDFSTPVTQDISLVAVWNPITYTVSFNKGASTSTISMADQTFTYDVEQELRENLFEAPSGYKFGGWSRVNHTSIPATIEKDFNDKQSVKNLSSQDGEVINLYALWIDRSRGNITYVLENYDTSSLEPKTYLPSETVTLPVATSTTLIRTGYTFAGWYTTDNWVSTTEITGWTSGEREGDITVYGKWESVSYNITYGNTSDWTWSGTSGPASYTIEDPVSLGTPVRTGYNFEGWFDSQDANNNGSGNQVNDWFAGEKTGDITLYPKWTPGTVNYTVKYYFQPVSGSTVLTDYETNTSYPDETVTGTTGQQTSASARTVEGFTAQTITQETIAADGSTVVKVYYDRRTITYTFNCNSSQNEAWADPAETGIRQGLYGTSYEAPVIEKTGYDFVDWGTTLDGTFGSSDMTLTANWTEGTVNYTVKYHFQPVSGSTVLTDYEPNTSYPDETRTGTTGSVTAVEASSGHGYTVKPITQKTIAADGSTVVDVYFDRATITYTFTFGDGESWVDPDETGERTGLYGQNFTLPQVRKNAWYNFDNGTWVTTGSGTNLSVTDSSFTFGVSDVDYQTDPDSWQETEYTITYNFTGGLSAVNPPNDIFPQSFTYSTRPSAFLNYGTGTKWPFLYWCSDESVEESTKVESFDWDNLDNVHDWYLWAKWDKS